MKAIHHIQQLIYRRTKINQTPVESLMSRLTDTTVLRAAWKQVLQNGRHVAGKDGITPAAILKRDTGATGFLDELAENLIKKKYAPAAVRRFEIPKGDGTKTRTISVLSVKDRVLHTAFKLLLEPILEARLGKQCYGFRPGRSRFDELVAIRRMIAQQPKQFQVGLTADVASCFDQLDHRQIRREFQSLVDDKHLLHTLDLILNQVGAGQEGWFSGRKVGLLQGSPLSPLLANLALSPFDRAWKKEYQNAFPLLRYADDLIVLAPDVKTAQRLEKSLAKMLKRICKLGLAPQKTRIASFEQGVSLLGMIIRRELNPFEFSRHVQIFVDPQKIRELFREMDQWAESLESPEKLPRQFSQFNKRLRGWFETFQFAWDAPQAFSSLDYYLFRTVRDQLRKITGLSQSQLNRQHHRYLPSKHETWGAEFEELLVLSSLPRSVFRPKRNRLPWEKKNETSESNGTPNLRVTPRTTASSPPIYEVTPTSEETPFDDRFLNQEVS